MDEAKTASSDRWRRCWGRVSGIVNTCHDGDSFEEFIARNPQLLDCQLPERHYSSETLWSAGARREWVEPDLLPLPSSTQSR
jgi:hypothetical protein